MSAKGSSLNAKTFVYCAEKSITHDRGPNVMNYDSSKFYHNVRKFLSLLFFEELEASDVVELDLINEKDLF